MAIAASYELGFAASATTTWNVLTWPSSKPRALSVTAPVGIDVYIGSNKTDGGAVSGNYWIVPGGQTHALEVAGSDTVAIAAASATTVRLTGIP